MYIYVLKKKRNLDIKYTMAGHLRAYHSTNTWNQHFTAIKYNKIHPQHQNSFQQCLSLQLCFADYVFSAGLNLIKKLFISWNNEPYTS